MMPYKILVVDDEDNIRTLVQTMLKQEGRQVVLAARGKEAIAMFKKERPNLTILDIDMPDIDGITVLREIRTIDPLARVMVFTGGIAHQWNAKRGRWGSPTFSGKGSLCLRLPSSSPAVRRPRSDALAYATRATAGGVARNSLGSFGGQPCLGFS
jgi:CheY-like chemotaxis protein